MKVAVAAWVGAGNLGDELLLSATRRLIADTGAVPVVLSLSARETVRLHGVEAVDHRRTWSALDDAAAMVFGGGGLVQDATSIASPPYQLHRPWLATLRGTPVVGLGLGATPLRYATSRAFARRSLGPARALVARDAGSAQVLRGLGLEQVEIGADLAFTLPPPPPSSPVDRLLVALRPRFAPGGIVPGRLRRRQDDHERFASAVAAQLDAAARTTGLEVAFLSMEPRRDDPLHEAIGERMGTPVHWLTPSLGELLATVATARVVVASRFHAGVAAVLGGRPTVLLAYANKVSGLATLLGDATVLRDHGVDGVSDLAVAVRSAAAVAPERVLEARARAVGAAAVNATVLERVLGSTAGGV